MKQELRGHKRIRNTQDARPSPPVPERTPVVSLHAALSRVDVLEAGIRQVLDIFHSMDTPLLVGPASHYCAWCQQDLPSHTERCPVGILEKAVDEIQR